MKKMFYLDGGAGRIIAAIPAFLKYAKLHPDEEWYILIPAWDYLYWGIPELQDRTFGIDTKGIFDTLITQMDEIITVEPYRIPGYFNQKISLGQAIDQQINNTTDHSDLLPPKMVLSIAETTFAKQSIADIKAIQKKQKTIIFQPFGRGAKIDKDKGTVSDDEARSLSSSDYVSLMMRLATRYNVIFFGEQDYHLKSDKYSAKFVCDIRQWAALVSECDYFIGCDSLGQHLARAFNIPGTVIFGSTFPVNTSYPDFFHIIENKSHKKYSPIRLTGLDSMLANRLNESSMKFTDKELTKIHDSIIIDIERTSSSGEKKNISIPRISNKPAFQPNTGGSRTKQQ
jgi:hypothetical protein